MDILDAFEKFEYLAARKEPFQIAIPTIVERKGKVVGFDINSLVWNEVKFLQDDGKTLHADMDSIPNNSGGIYIFHIKSDVLPNVIRYTMYIGRAQNTDTTYSLKSRCRSYVKDERVSIKKWLNIGGLTYT